MRVPVKIQLDDLDTLDVSPVRSRAGKIADVIHDERVYLGFDCGRSYYSLGLSIPQAQQLIQALAFCVAEATRETTVLQQPAPPSGGE